MTYFNMRMSRGMPGRGRRHCGWGRGRPGKFITDIHVRERKELEEDDQEKTWKWRELEWRRLVVAILCILKLTHNLVNEDSCNVDDLSLLSLNVTDVQYFLVNKLAATKTTCRCCRRYIVLTDVWSCKIKWAITKTTCLCV